MYNCQHALMLIEGAEIALEELEGRNLANSEITLRGALEEHKIASDAHEELGS